LVKTSSLHPPTMLQKESQRKLMASSAQLMASQVPLVARGQVQPLGSATRQVPKAEKCQLCLCLSPYPKETTSGQGCLLERPPSLVLSAHSKAQESLPLPLQGNLLLLTVLRVLLVARVQLRTSMQLRTLWEMSALNVSASQAMELLVAKVPLMQTSSWMLLRLATGQAAMQPWEWRHLAKEQQALLSMMATGAPVVVTVLRQILERQHSVMEQQAVRAQMACYPQGELPHMSQVEI